MQLTKNFSLYEMLYSNTANRLQIHEQYFPNEEVVERLTHLCQHVLQPLRNSLGQPIIITSGYRCRRLNQALGGSTNSQHIKGEAADLIVSKMTVEELYQHIKKSPLPYDQLIQEFGRWIHISFRSSLENNRRESLRATYLRGKVHYQKDW
jgi:zinc D-Ala-D-Ala carboxypeptidase